MKHDIWGERGMSEAVEAVEQKDGAAAPSLLDSIMAKSNLAPKDEGYDIAKKVLKHLLRSF